MDELVKLWHDGMLPAAQSQPGWVSARLLVDRLSGKVLVVGMWASEADAMASSGGAHAERQRQLLGDLLTAAPLMEHFEVAGDA